MINQEIALEKQEVALENLPRKQRGLTTVEYVVAGAGIVLAVVVIFGTMGTRIQTVLQSIITAL